MQKWEYLFVTREWDGDVCRLSWVNGQQDRNWKRNAPLHEFANQMGDEGWELAGIATLAGLVFKRSKA
jgi:hypothetical protein